MFYIIPYFNNHQLFILFEHISFFNIYVILLHHINYYFNAMNSFKVIKTSTPIIFSNINMYNPKLFIPAEPINTPKRPYIKRIIALIGTGISTVEDITDELDPSKNDYDKITDLIGDLIDNKDLMSVVGISTTFVCRSNTYHLYESAFDAIKEATVEPGFFDSMFLDN